MASKRSTVCLDDDQLAELRAAFDTVSRPSFFFVLPVIFRNAFSRISARLFLWSLSGRGLAARGLQPLACLASVGFTGSLNRSLNANPGATISNIQSYCPVGILCNNILLLLNKSRLVILSETHFSVSIKAVNVDRLGVIITYIYRRIICPGLCAKTAV